MFAKYFATMGGLLIISIVLFPLIISVQSCRPDWDDQCQKHVECCSGYCHRSHKKWLTGAKGVCKEKKGSNKTRGSTTWRANTTTTSSPDLRRRGTGDCSWYGDSNEIPQGSHTSCGDIFDPDAMASSQLGQMNPKLAWGTKVRVTNIANGKTVDVVINDSGMHGGRLLDLTYAAFGKIEDRSKGVTPCSFVVL